MDKPNQRPQTPAMPKGNAQSEWLDIIERNRWTVTWLSFSEVWIIQRDLQVNGNIGKDPSLKKALRQAIKTLDSPTAGQ